MSGVCPVRPLAVIAAGLSASLVLCSLAVSAAPFTPGNVVVYRVGSGTGSLVATGSPVFLDEYAPTGGARVQSIALPATGSGAQKALVASGTAVGDGLLTRSANGNCLAVPGYARDIGTGAGNVATAGTLADGSPIPRAVARVTATGAIDTSTALTDAAVGSNIRGAATADCNAFWVSGGVGGVRYATLGSTTSADLTSTTFANLRGVAVAGGQLYASLSVTAIRGVATVGSGMPTVNPQTVTKLPGFTDANAPNTHAFFFADLNPGVPGVDTLYIADEAAGVLSKFSLVGGTWVLNGTIGTAADAYRGVTGAVNASTVTLFATRKGGSTGTGGGELVALTDASGHNGAFAGSPSIIATAAANTAFRGIAMAPAVTVTPSADANGSISPSTPITVAGNATPSFTVTAAPGYTAQVASTCGGALNGNVYTTNPVSANCTVAATFTALPTFAVTPSAGPNGTIGPSSVQHIVTGTTTTFNVVPASGYLATVGGTCGGMLNGTVFTTNPITADCTVTASFNQITYNVTSTAGANGTISPMSTQAVPVGNTASFTVTPVAGYAAAVAGTCGGMLNGNTFTTNPITTDCSVNASFTALPTYTITPSAGANGAIFPASPQTMYQGGTSSFTITPAPGYHAAVRGTCGGAWVGDSYVTRPVTANCTVAATFSRKLVLFVGNSYTFGRVDPVMSYNAANVTDLTYHMWLANPTGSNEDEPHPWGGIPGVFKKLTDQAGLDWDVSISARNAASLRGHFLNSNPAGWDLRSNVASQRWDIVMLQDLSDEPLPFGRSANASLGYFNAYADKFERWIHNGAAETYTESSLFGGTSQCQAATGGSANACNTVRTISPANSNATAATDVWLYETWARPDLIAPNGTNVNGTTYTQAEGLETMTADFHNAYFGRAAANPNFRGVSPVGDAFLRAVTEGFAMRDPYVPQPSKINLWHTDFFHPSKYGSYLSALVHFATLTGLNPLSLGANEQAATDLGISPDDAFDLQLVAQLVVAPDVTPPTSSAVASPAPGGNGYNDGPVTVSIGATDNTTGSGVEQILFALSGAQSAPATAGNAVTITAEGQTIVSFFAVDRAGNVEVTKSLTVKIARTAPSTTATVAPAANANGWHRSDVTVTFNASDIPFGSGIRQVNYTLSGAQAGAGIVANGSSIVISVEGTTTVTFYATNNAGIAEAPKSIAVRLDKTPPQITGMPGSACSLWPPNHKLVQVATVASSDGGSGMAQFAVNATSSEQASPGESDTAIGGSGLGPRTVTLRAERLGTGNGRVYTVTATASDLAGNTSSITSTCVVPKSM